MRTIDRILELASERGIKQKFINELVNGYRGKVTEWKNGKSTPSDEELIIIAEFFQVSVAYLKGETNKKKETPAILTDGERDKQMANILTMYALLTEDKQKIAFDVIQAMVLAEKKDM